MNNLVQYAYNHNLRRKNGPVTSLLSMHPVDILAFTEGHKSQTGNSSNVHEKDKRKINYSKVTH